MATGLKETLITSGGAEEIQRLIEEYESDIKEDLAVEAYRREGGARGRGASRKAKQAILIHSQEGRIVAVNHNLLEMLGYPADELLAAGIDKIFTNNLEAQNLQAEIGHAGYIIDYRARLRHKDGREAVGLITSTIRWYNDESTPGNQPLFKSWVRLSK